MQDTQRYVLLKKLLHVEIRIFFNSLFCNQFKAQKNLIFDHRFVEETKKWNAANPVFLNSIKTMEEDIAKQKIGLNAFHIDYIFYNKFLLLIKLPT